MGINFSIVLLQRKALNALLTVGIALVFPTNSSSGHDKFCFPEFPLRKPDLLSHLDHREEATALDLHISRDTPAAGEALICSCTCRMGFSAAHPSLK